MMADGATEQDILENYLFLEKEVIRACILCKSSILITATTERIGIIRTVRDDFNQESDIDLLFVFEIVMVK